MNNNFKLKYIKYKFKYLNLKKQIGGELFNDLSYLGQGAESYVYSKGDNEVLKIIKKPESFIPESEIEISNKLKENGLDNFMYYQSIGTCYSNLNPDEATTKFCITEPSGSFTYQYIIMRQAKGTNLLRKFYLTFNDYLKGKPIVKDNEELISLIEKYISDYLIILKNLALNLKLANEKIGFRHGDLDYRNFTVDESNNVYIYDFGSSRIDVFDSYECMDFRSALISSLNSSYLKSETVLQKEYITLTEEDKTKITSNGNTILKLINKNIKIDQLLKMLRNSCNQYMYVSVSYDKILEILV